MSTEPAEKIAFPFILFQIQNRVFCVNSRYVSSIMELPEYRRLPDTPPYITGIFSHRGGSITMFDLRAALNLPTMSEEFDEFSSMLDARKQDHITWVSTLEECIRENKAFTLATDAHRCALGRWYDSFRTDSQELSHHLAAMEEPHQRLHQASVRVTECMRIEEPEERDAAIQAVMRDVREECVPRILAVLDDAKEIFRTRVYHGMVLLLSGERKLGLVVDAVLAVEHLSEERTETGFKDWCFSPYLSRIMHSGNSDDLILEVNIPEILRSGEAACAAAE